MDNTNTSTANTEQTDKLFVPFLGQSNAGLMSKVFDPYKPGMTENSTSGTIVLDENLTSLTGTEIVTSENYESEFAIGGGRVSGDGGFKEDYQVFWYPEQDEPGKALLATVEKLKQWLSVQEAQPTDEIAIIWAQGESDVSTLGQDPDTAKEIYKQSTLKIFDYLQDNLEYANVKFYVELTGNLQENSAANVGYSPEGIEVTKQGIEVAREVQTEIALERDDVQLAADYSDLDMIYDEGMLYGEDYNIGEEVWSRDLWHVGYDGMKVNGKRLAEYIALDRGENNVISFTNATGEPAESISMTRAGLLDLEITDNPSLEAISGTKNPDLLVGTTSADEIIGGAGNDVIIAGKGIDNLTGGAGNDVYFFDASISADMSANGDLITDFELDRDRLDVSLLLELTNDADASAVASKYLIFNPLSADSLEIKFDADGAGSQTANTFVTLENIDSQAFLSNVSNQLIVAPIEI